METKVEVETDDKDTKEYEDHELEAAVETLLKAEKIKKDEKLMKAIKPLIDEKSKAVKKIGSLKELRQVIKEKSESSD